MQRSNRPPHGYLSNDLTEAIVPIEQSNGAFARDRAGFTRRSDQAKFKAFEIGGQPPHSLLGPTYHVRPDQHVGQYAGFIWVYSCVADQRLNPALKCCFIELHNKSSMRWGQRLQRELRHYKGR